MIQLLVFSDTHNSSRRMLRVLEREEDAAACFFLGDGARDADDLQTEYPRLALYRVQGNCDFDGFDPSEGLVAFGGLLFFYTHGHAYQVKSTLTPLWMAAKSRGADVALFGHTHVPHYEYREGIHLFNPGSLAIPRGGGPSYGRIVLGGEQPLFEVCPY